MISKLVVQNFKSIKKLELAAKRVNLFIGEPNVGKSNILESLALYALPIHGVAFKDLVRFQDLGNVFFENDPANPIFISSESGSITLNFDRQTDRINFKLDHGNIHLERFFDANGTLFGANENVDLQIHPYYFKTTARFDNKRLGSLLPPHGNNLFSILQSNRTLKSLIAELIHERGFKLTFRQSSSEIEFSKEENNVLTIYPYEVISDTLQRMIFYVAAIESNLEQSVLILEEPESNVFPYYTKYLAEKIALDSQRQYFITTHNPYFLQSIVEKTPLDELALNVVTLENFQTKVTTLNKRGVEEALDLNNDVFLNFDRLIE
jgi:AAA15 family ATPase/GTPase